MKNELDLLRKENKLRKHHLLEKDQEMIRRMMNYMSSSKISSFDLEVTHKKLIGMALGAMERKESLKDVLNKDEKAFCDEIIKNNKKPSKSEITLKATSIFLLNYGMMLLIYILFIDRVGAIDFGSFMLYAAPLWSIALVLLKLFIRNRYTYEKGFKRYIPGGICIVALIGISYLQDFWAKKTLFYIDRWLVWILLIVGIFVGRLLYDQYIHYRAKEYAWLD